MSRVVWKMAYDVTSQLMSSQLRKSVENLSITVEEIFPEDDEYENNFREAAERFRSLSP